MPEEPVPSLPALLAATGPHLLNSASLVLRTSGVHDVITLDDSRRVAELLQHRPVAVLVVDLNMPYVSGQDVLEAVNQEHPDLPVIVMTAINDLDTAVQCMQAGA